jgi:ABC-2 type transport system permease protein
MRSAITDGPTLATGWIALGIVAATVAFAALGLKGFLRRAVD